MMPVRIAAKLHRVSERIQSRERKHLSHKESARNMEGKWATICPQIDARLSVYRSTPPDELYNELKQFIKATGIKLSGLRAADLGSGFGASSIALSYFCRSVTGYEIHAPFIKDARAVTREFGYRNIRFRNGDFIEADLTRFKLWYVYYPFFADFGETMAHKINEASPGTLIILKSCLHPQLIGLDNTEMLYPADMMAARTHEFNVMRKL